jgi:acetolactate synthase-1/2/3 large subunit
MAERHGGHLLAECLQRQGVEVVFTLCGNHVLPVYEGLYDAGIRLVDARTEAGAVMAADAYARATRRPAVALVTGGPGHTNALTGLATAHAAGSPVVLLSGQGALRTTGRGAQQEMRQAESAAPLCKWAQQVTHVDQLAEVVAEAFTRARTGVTGAVHLSLPIDVLEQTPSGDRAPRERREPPRYAPPSDAVDEAARMLADARRPVVIAGNGAYMAHAEGELQRLLERTGLPLFTVDLARGMVSDDHELVFGYADPSLNPVARRISEADVILILGKNLDFRLRYGSAPFFSASAKVIQVEPDSTNLGRNREPDLALVSDVRSFVAALLDRAPNQRWHASAWAEDLRATPTVSSAAGSGAAADASSADGSLHPLAVAQEIQAALPQPVSLVFDAGDFVQWCRAVLPARGAGRWIRLGPMSTCGAGTPLALGMKLAKRDDPVVLLTGDGSFGYYLIEFEAALRQRLPFVAVVGNNSCWGLEYNLQRGLYGDDYVLASELSDVRYDRVISALGGYGERVTSLGDIGPALRRALDSGVPACLDVPVSRAPSPLTEAVIARGGEV